MRTRLEELNWRTQPDSRNRADDNAEDFDYKHAKPVSSPSAVKAQRKKSA